MAVSKEMTEKQKGNVPSNNKVAFAKLLAGNDKKIRDKGLKKLTRWLSARSTGSFEFTENDLMTIWVGLFYSMWMSDMPLVQEDLAESLSCLIHSFKQNDEATLLFIKCFNKTMNNTWPTLDQFRVDKFSMLVRRFLRQSLVWLEKHEWAQDLIHQLMTVYSETVLADSACLGFKLQFTEVFLEELAKVSNGELNPKAVVAFCTPFAKIAATTRDGRVRLQLEKFFKHLLKQTDLALDYEEKFDAWKRAGCPGGDVNQMVLVPDEEGEGEENLDLNGREEDSDAEMENSLDNKGPLDPRAGSVHVSLPQIQLPALKLAKMAKSLVNLPTATLKGKRMMLNLRRQFRKMSQGKYPLVMKKIGDDDPVRMKQLINDAVKKSVKLEVKQHRKRALMKKKIRKIKKSRKSSKNNEEVSAENVEEETPEEASEEIVETKKVKKRKRSENKKESPSPKQKKPRTGFDVSPAQDTETNASVNGTADLDAELPPGWIVESADTPKKSKINGTVEENTPTAPEPKSSTKKAKKQKTEQAVTPSGEVESQNGINGSEDNEVVITIKSPHSFFKRALDKATPKKSITPEKISTPVDVFKMKAGRRISFNLQRNMAQEKDEYFEQLQRSPQIPFDAGKVPKQSALKAGLPQSPINPFYERLLFKKK